MKSSDAGLRERNEFSAQIAGPVPLVRMRRVLPLAGAHHVAGAGKGRDDSPARAAVVKPPA